MSRVLQNAYIYTKSSIIKFTIPLNKVKCFQTLSHMACSLCRHGRQAMWRHLTFIPTRVSVCEETRNLVTSGTLQRGRCEIQDGRHFHTRYKELLVTVHWITMNTCRIPYENACRTGFRNLCITCVSNSILFRSLATFTVFISTVDFVLVTIGVASFEVLEVECVTVAW